MICEAVVLEIVPQPVPAQPVPVGAVQVTPCILVSRPKVATKIWVCPSSILIVFEGET